MVSNILGMVAGGYTVDKILSTFSELVRDDVVAAIEYAPKSSMRSRSSHIDSPNPIRSEHSSVGM